MPKQNEVYRPELKNAVESEIVQGGIQGIGGRNAMYHESLFTGWGNK